MQNKILSVYKGDDTVENIHLMTGEKILTDLPPDNGGKGRRFSPTDLLAAALSSCILTIMSKIANKEGIDIRGSSIEIEKVMSDKPPRRVIRFNGKIKLTGVPENKKETIMNAIKSCPVSKSLHPDIEISFSD